jgi:hypothetical protein
VSKDIRIWLPTILKPPKGKTSRSSKLYTITLGYIDHIFH